MDPNRKELLRLIREHQSALIRHCQELVGNLEISRELVQETFIRLCERPEIWQDPQVKAWLHRVAHNLAIDHLRKQKPQASVQVLEARSSKQPSPEQQLKKKQDRIALASAFKALPERQREALRLRLDSDLSYKEIGHILGISLSNVGFMIYDGIKRLTKELNPQPVQPSEPMQKNEV